MTRLVPTSEWIYYLWKVDYFATEDSEEILHTRYLVSTDTHVQGEVCEYHFPSNAHYAKWESIRECRKPRVVGNLYGMPLHESGWAAAERETK